MSVLLHDSYGALTVGGSDYAFFIDYAWDLSRSGGLFYEFYLFKFMAGSLESLRAFRERTLASFKFFATFRHGVLGCHSGFTSSLARVLHCFIRITDPKSVSFKSDFDSEVKPMDLLKSKLLRNEIKHWLLVMALTLWGLVATSFAFSKKEKILLIGIDDAGVRTITSQSDRLLKAQLQNFMFEFLKLYYAYDEKSFLSNVGKATDLFSEDLWNQKKTELSELNSKLQKNPLTQKLQVEAIDLIENGKIETSLLLKIHSRLNTQEVKLQVFIEYKESERSSSNPWGYQITGITEKIF